MSSNSDIAAYDFEMLSTGDYSRTWGLVDKATGVSLLDDSSDLTLILQKQESSVPDLTLVIRADTTASGIVLDPDVETNGEFLVTIRRTDAAALLGSKEWQAVNYNFLSIETDGMRVAYATGVLTIRKGL